MIKAKEREKIDNNMEVEYEDSGNKKIYFRGLLIRREYPDGSYVRYDYDINDKLEHIMTSTGFESWYNDKKMEIHYRLPDGSYEVWYDDNGEKIREAIYGEIIFEK